MRIGIRAHDIENDSLEELAEIAHKKNVKSFHFAPKKVINEFHIKKGCLTPGFAQYVKNILQKNELNISILGSYVNLANPDDDGLREEIETFKEHIRFAKYMGESVVATETGCYNREYVYTEKNDTEEAFQRSLNSIKEIVAEAEKFGIVVGIEGSIEHVMSTPQKLKRLLDNVKSNNLQIVFDPVNLIDASNYYKMDDIIKESFQLFGDRIICVHTKDFVYKDGKLKRVSIGTGQFNYTLLLSLIKESKPFIDIILEETVNEDRDASIKFIEETYKKI